MRCISQVPLIAPYPFLNYFRRKNTSEEANQLIKLSIGLAIIDNEVNEI